MGIDAGSVYSDLELRMDNYERNLQRAERQMNSFSTKMQKNGEKISKVGSTLTKTVTLPILGAGVAAFKLASDMEESVNKVDVAFKDNASEVKKWSETTLESFGIAQGSALDMVALFGDMATSMEIPTKEAANMSTELVGLAGDLASFKNIGISQAENALKGIFTGETESLKNLGIVMTQTNLESYALANGFKKTYKEMSESEKVNLRYQYVLGKTQNAQGDFAKTSDGAANQMRIFSESLKELGATFGENLLPVITPIIQKVNEAVQKFGDLDKDTQQNIIKMAGFAAAMGPVLLGAGKLTSGIGGVVGILGKLAPAATTAATATSAVSAGIGGAGGAAGASTMLLNPWVLGLTAAGVAAVGLGVYLSQDALPQIELFGEGISASTEKAVQSYLDLEAKATEAIKQLTWSGQEITSEHVNEISALYNQMTDQVVTALEEERSESLQILNEMFAENKELTEEKKKEMLELTNKAYDDKITSTKDKEKEILEIINNSLEENGKMTEEAYKEIAIIQSDMQGTAVSTLSESAAEQKAIMENLKLNTETISADQAVAVVQSSIKQKDETIAVAEEEYNKRLKLAAALRAEGTEEAIKAADEIATSARKARDDSVEAAKEMHDDVVREAKKQSGEHVNEINFETGELRSKWDMALGYVALAFGLYTKDTEMNFEKVGKSIDSSEDKIDEYNNVKVDDKDSKWDFPISEVGKSIDALNSWNNKKVNNKTSTWTTRYVSLSSNAGAVGKNARGTNNWRGGLTWVGEEGPELVDLPQGSKVYSAQQSQAMSKTTVEHSGTIRVEGVNSKNELIAVFDKLVDKLQTEVRLYG